MRHIHTRSQHTARQVLLSVSSSTSKWLKLAGDDSCCIRVCSVMVRVPRRICSAMVGVPRRICSAMVGVLHRSLIPALPTTRCSCRYHRPHPNGSSWRETTTKTPTARRPRRRLASQARPPLVVVIVIVVVMVIVIGTVKVANMFIVIVKIESIGNLVLARWRSLLLFLMTVEPRVE